MVDGINSNGNGKEWINCYNTTQDKDYLNALDKKIASILGGKETISVDKLRKNSVFSNLSKAAEERFNDIAKMDGDAKTLSADELRVLYSLADAKLENNQFKFDTNFEIDGNSGLEQATDKEVNAMIQNLVKSDARKRIETLDTSKYDTKKAFADKIQSNDVDEVMLAMRDKLSVGINKATGESLSIVQAVLLLERCVKTEHGYDEGCNAFTQMTGIPASDFQRLRCPGDGDSFTIGDWKYDRGNLTNSKTGESLTIERVGWRNTTTHTVPASDGNFAFVKSYNDGNGTSLQFKYGDAENIAPTSANVTVNGETRSISYSPKLLVDPNIYNYLEK